MARQTKLHLLKRNKTLKSRLRYKSRCGATLNCKGIREKLKKVYLGSKVRLFRAVTKRKNLAIRLQTMKAQNG